MPNCDVVVQTASADETQALGARLATALRPGDVLALSGDLGSGKTAFTQGIARGLHVGAPVTSPTFTLINRYRAPDGRVLQHVDCYRLADAPAEMWDVGLADLLAGEDIVVIEWADRIPGLLPEEHLAVAFEYVDANSRRLCFRAYGVRPAQLVGSL